MTSNQKISIAVAGNINIDIIAHGFDRLADRSGVSFGEAVTISPGGKSRNIAVMLANFLGPDRVAMLGKTAKDPTQLWRIAIDSLTKAGVNIDFVSIIENGMPGMALIPVDSTGRHHIYAIPGANEQFSTDDLESGLLAGSSNLFEMLVANHGILLTTLEAPLPVVRHLLALGKQYHLPVVLDPGGFQAGRSYEDILGPDIFLLKPNQAELEHLTGLEAKDISSATNAARLLRQKGIPNVLVTLGANGALLVTETQEIHIRIPLVAPNNGGTQDETGCGDQATAALCASLLAGQDLLEAAQAAVVAGTLQFYRKGVVPLTYEELSIKLSEIQDSNKAGS